MQAHLKQVRWQWEYWENKGGRHEIQSMQIIKTCAPRRGPQRADWASSFRIDFPQLVSWTTDAEKDEGKRGRWLGGPPFLQGGACASPCHCTASEEDHCSPLHSWDQIQDCPLLPRANCTIFFTTLWIQLSCMLKLPSVPMDSWRDGKSISLPLCSPLKWACCKNEGLVFTKSKPLSVNWLLVDNLCSSTCFQYQRLQEKTDVKWKTKCHNLSLKTEQCL